MNLFVSYHYNAKRGDVSLAGYGNVTIMDFKQGDDPYFIDLIRGHVIKAAKDQMGVDELNPTILFFKEIGA